MCDFRENYQRRYQNNHQTFSLSGTQPFTDPLWQYTVFFLINVLVVLQFTSPINGILVTNSWHEVTKFGGL